jgi:hypothetical protein
MPVVMCRRPEFKWGLHKMTVEEWAYMYNIQHYEHYSACDICVMFGTKGLTY